MPPDRALSSDCRKCHPIFSPKMLKRLVLYLKYGKNVFFIDPLQLEYTIVGGTVSADHDDHN